MKSFLIFASACILLCMPGCTDNEGSFPKWEKIELTFKAPRAKANSLHDTFNVEIDVRITSPNGKEFLLPAFIDGVESENHSAPVWKARFSADRTGKWKYETESTDQVLDGIKGTFEVADPLPSSSGFYRWGRLEAVSEAGSKIRYLKFREGPYWLKAGCDDPENFLGNFIAYNTNEKRKAAIDYLSSKDINSLYIITNNINGDGKDVWPWLGDDQNVAKQNSTGEIKFNFSKMEKWRELFEYMQAKGMVVYIVLEDDSGWKGYDHRKYYREMIARFGYLPALIFNINEEYNENYTKQQALDLAMLLKDTDPFRHPVGIHNINQPDGDYIKATQVDFTSIQTGSVESGSGPSPEEYHRLVTSWIEKCKSLSARTLMVGIDEGRPEGDRRAWWSTYLSGGVWEAHVPGPYDKPMETWDTIWTMLGGTRRFMESIPFWQMEPDTTVLKDGKAFCLSDGASQYAFYLPEGGNIEISTPGNKTYEIAWWDPRNGNNGCFSNISRSGGGILKLSPPSEGDWALKISGL